MKKIVKKFFLIISEEPILVSLLTSTGMFFLSLQIFYWITGQEPTINVIEISFLSFFIIFICLATLNYKVVKKYITVFSEEHEYLILLHNCPGHVVRYRGPLWGKFKTSFIELPDQWSSEAEEGTENKLKVNLNILLSNGINVYVPIMYTVYFSGPFDANNLKNVLGIRAPKSSDTQLIRAQDYFQYLFENNNYGPDYESIKRDALKCYTGKISDYEFADRLKEKLKFPKDLLKNVKITRTEIVQPEFQKLLEKKFDCQQN